MAWVASSGGVVGFDGVDDGGFDGFDGVEWWLRWRRWWFGGLVASMASMVGVDRRWWTGVFDTEGTDVEVPLCPQW